jgi:uncharacterized protein (DUF1800 family)
MSKRFVTWSSAAIALGAASLMPLAAQAQSPTRAQIQHLLRRFSYSASPEDVTTVFNEGIAAWLASQDNWQALDDSGSELETIPTELNDTGGYPDYNVFERIVMQHMVLTPRQLQAKLELHWLDHFAVGLSKVGDPAIQYHYDQTVRANALGNFTTLMTAVAEEAAMLVWLDNNWNVGPTANENFSRECQQLYTGGLYQLNMDGSTKLGTDGTPKLNYTQGDVQEIAKAITGYGVVVDYTNNDPETRFSVQYFTGNHYSGQIKFFGKVQNVPNDSTAIAYVMNIIAKRPSVAPFEARELLQRFVTENPSPEYIAAIAQVWKDKQDAPDQIAQVINAIVNYPEFMTSYRSMPKQPAELVVGSLRQMPGMMQATQNTTPGSSILWELHNLGQQLFYPVSVFSFYRPGGLNALTNTGSILERTEVFANEVDGTQSNTYTDTWIDIPTLRARIGSTDAKTIRKYLLDALLDGGSAKEDDTLKNYLGDTPSDARLQGAIWLLLNAPDYTVN